MDLIDLEQSVGPKVLVGTWVSSFLKLEPLRMLKLRERGGWVGLPDLLRVRIM